MLRHVICTWHLHDDAHYCSLWSKHYIDMQIELEDEVATDLQRATGLADDGAPPEAALQRTMQLTGLSDAVYAEAVVITHQYDVVLDVTVINRTSTTMQSLCLELATMGDLKLVERPQNYTLAAGESKRLRANIKVRCNDAHKATGHQTHLHADRLHVHGS